MVEVGSLEIVGSFDVSSIKSGLTQLEGGLDSARSNAKSAFGDMEKLGGTLGDVADKATMLGTGVTSALIGLASMGPATAPALARINTSFFRMTRTLAESLVPAFENFADLFEGFVGWLDSEQGNSLLEGLNSVLISISEGAKDAGIALSEIGQSVSVLFDFSLGEGSVNDFVGWLIDRGAFPLLASYMGFKVGGPLGAGAAGAGAMATQEVGRHVQGEPSLFEGVVSGGILNIVDIFKGFSEGVASGKIWEQMILNQLPRDIFGENLFGLDTSGVGMYNVGDENRQSVDKNVSVKQSGSSNGYSWMHGYRNEEEFEQYRQDYFGLQNQGQ